LSCTPGKNRAGVYITSSASSLSGVTVISSFLGYVMVALYKQLRTHETGEKKTDPQPGAERQEEAEGVLRTLFFYLCILIEV
jgi:hypothetical protein